MNTHWYFAALIMALCAVVLAGRIWDLTQKFMASRERKASIAPKRSLLGDLGRRWANYLAGPAGDWYCFFHISDLTGTEKKSGRKASEIRKIKDQRKRACL